MKSAVIGVINFVGIFEPSLIVFIIVMYEIG